MNTTESVEEAVDVLQKLGLNGYEARCFVGLSRLSTGTAKKLGEITEVPRTRVYDAIRVLEAQGLVEIQHSSPQQFRAVSLAEAMETLHSQHEARIDRLQDALEPLETVAPDDGSPVEEVWAMTGRDPIGSRTTHVISKATDEVVFVVGDESLLTPELLACLNGLDPAVDLFVGALTESLQSEVQGAVPEAETFVPGVEWLFGDEDKTAISRLLLVDRSTVLVSSVMPGSRDEQAVFGTGFGNGLVVIARRLMAQGLLTERDPAP